MPNLRLFEIERSHLQISPVAYFGSNTCTGRIISLVTKDVCLKSFQTKNKNLKFRREKQNAKILLFWKNLNLFSLKICFELYINVEN